MTRRVLRWVIPVDGKDHAILGRGEVGRVELCLDPRSDDDLVEFWTFPEDLGAPPPFIPRSFCVFGTGHEIPEGYQWCGTAPRTPHGLVWHLFERVGS